MEKSVTIPIYKKGYEHDCNNYRGILMLQTTYKISSNSLVSRLTLYVGKITGDYQCGFRRNRSAADQIFCIRQI